MFRSIFTLLRVPSVIRPLGDTRLVGSIQLSKWARDGAALHNVLAQHPIFANRLRSVRREDKIFYAILQNGNKMLAMCVVLPQNKSGPERMVKIYCCNKPLAHVWLLCYLNEKLLSLSLKN